MIAKIVITFFKTIIRIFLNDGMNKNLTILFPEFNTITCCIFLYVCFEFPMCPSKKYFYFMFYLATLLTK